MWGLSKAARGRGCGRAHGRGVSAWPRTPGATQTFLPWTCCLVFPKLKDSLFWLRGQAVILSGGTGG